MPRVQPLIAYLSLYHGQTEALQTQPVEVTTDKNGRLKTIPFRFSVPLDHLPPGKYDCQVTILDPTGQKAAFWQVPIMLLP